MRSVLATMARFASYGSALFLMAMMLVTVADVLLRAFFNLPITGAYDLVQLFLVGTVFLSIPEVFLDDENIVVDFIDHVFGPAAIGCLKTVASVAGFIFVAVAVMENVCTGAGRYAVQGSFAGSLYSDDCALGTDDSRHRAGAAGGCPSGD